MAQALKRTFDQGVLVGEEWVDVPDPEPTEAEIVAAQLAAVEARLTAVREALAESTNAAIRDVATRITAKEGGIPQPPVRSR